MTCREFADFIIDYIGGELPADVVAGFERHISVCPNCREYLTQYEATVAAGRDAFTDDDAAVPAEVPEDLIQAILATRR